MQLQWPKLEKVSHLIQGQYICFFQCFKSFTTCLENKNTVFIDNHNTSRLVDQFKSLSISILSQDVLNEIGKPHSEWRYPRNIRNKCQKDKYVSEKQKQLLTVRLQNLHITEYKGKSFQVFFHDEKVSMTLLTKPHNISIGHRSLFVSLYASRSFKVIL